MKKSYLTQLILSILLGPLGMFYSSTAAAIGFLLAALIFGAMTYGLALLLIWPLCVIVSLYMVFGHNEKVDIEQKKHQELLQAMKANRS